MKYADVELETFCDENISNATKQNEKTWKCTLEIKASFNTA